MALNPVLRELARRASDTVEGAPPGALLVAPQAIADLVEVVARADVDRTSLLIWGGGSHQGLGNRVDAELVLATSRLNALVDWQPDDLTVVVGVGMKVADLESRLAERGQTALLPEHPGLATVGGVVASGVSGFRRLRYGPTRDRVLEVRLVTGDGRQVRGGGRVVKNVTGYDLPRLACGSLGRLGVITEVCLKLSPLPEATMTVSVEDRNSAKARLYRPLSILADQRGSYVYLAGTRAEVEEQVARLDGSAREGLHWPPDPDGPFRFSLRVPPRLLDEACVRLPETWEWLALVGVGEIRIGAPGAAGATEARVWAESVGGALVVIQAPEAWYQEFDPWGTPPPGTELTAKLSEAFDPHRILNRRRLPGGV